MSGNQSESAPMSNLPLVMASGLFAVPMYEHQNPKEWLEVFETSSELMKVDNKDKLRLFTEWATFKKEFLERFTITRISAKPALKKLFELKRGACRVCTKYLSATESLREYAERSDDLRVTHLNETKKNNRMTKLTDQDLYDTFINGLASPLVKTVVRQACPNSLTEAMHLVKSMDDNEEEDKIEDTEIFDTPYDVYEMPGVSAMKRLDHATTVPRGLNASSNYETSGGSLSSNSNTSGGNDSKHTGSQPNQAFQETMEKLSDSVRNLTLMMEARMNPRTDARSERRTPASQCYNCRDTAHTAKDCTRPCKLCQGSKGDHPYWKCELQWPAKPFAQNVFFPFYAFYDILLLLSATYNTYCLKVQALGFLMTYNMSPYTHPNQYYEQSKLKGTFERFCGHMF
ncbi:hypothetical protein G6F37_012217 [Rhizopus arrhizus]|nr:hypothetical protein G6F38_012641 [Rhizopus arrhizus]KAG1144982.1 hypothetical protein G6F37_012217 [Rhizopus arrhizus]